jgi:hypothetical protein
MLEQFLSEARSQTERTEPPVKAAALLHLARVWTAFDHAEAERLLETGIRLAFEIPQPAGDALRSQAVTLAAAVSPQRALRLMPLLTGLSPGREETIVSNMLRHGHRADAVSWLSSPDARVPYPFHAAVQAIGFSRGDQEAGRNILRGAIRAWRGDSKSGRSEDFEQLFVHCWKVIPEPEAAEVVREIVDRIKADADGKTSARFSSGWKTARFSSIRESRLFAVYGVVHRLGLELADSLCREYRQLAKAVVAFPRGYGQVPDVPVTENRKETPATRCEQPDLMTVDGRFRLLPMPEALKTNFRKPFAAALRLYVRDTDSENPNQAPKECWPSAMEFRNILYKAGQHQGLQAAQHLDRIPDRDLRLFAQIELIAGVTGLPQFGGMSIFPRRLPMNKRDRWRIM